LEEIRAIDKECPDKFRSQAKVEEYLESHPKVTEMLAEKFKDMLLVSS
jgi:hypothetical protein